MLNDHRQAPAVSIKEPAKQEVSRGYSVQSPHSVQAGVRSPMPEGFAFFRQPPSVIADPASPRTRTMGAGARLAFQISNLSNAGDSVDRSGVMPNHNARTSAPVSPLCIDRVGAGGDRL